MEQGKIFPKLINSDICKDMQRSEHPAQMLYNATPNCDGTIYSNFYSGGGVRCTKCSAWFCF